MASNISDGGDGFCRDPLLCAYRLQALQLPEVDCQTAGVVQDRLLIGKADAERGREIILFDLGLSLFEWPGDMVDAGAHGLAIAASREEAIALREEILKRSATAFHKLARGAESAIAGLENDRRPRTSAAAVERKFAFRTLL